MGLGQSIHLVLSILPRKLGMQGFELAEKKAWLYDDDYERKKLLLLLAGPPKRYGREEAERY